MTAQKERNHLLDGMRGIAAISVVGFHLAGFFHGSTLSGGYLAVDFFFVLSGLVIARSYDDRIATDMSATAFFGRRLIRIYPLFLLGLLLGAVKSVAQIIMHQQQAMSGPELVGAFLLNPLMLPVPFDSPLGFPLNGPLWSLSCEMAINLAYALLLARLRTIWLILSVVLGAVILSHGIFAGSHALNLGSNFETFGYGLARVTVGFGIGMLIARRLPVEHTPSSARSLLLIPALLGFFFVSVAAPYIVWRDAAFAFVAAPGIIWAGARVDVPRRMVPLFVFLGDLSFPLYALHYPIMLAVCFVGVRLHLPTAAIVVLVMLVTVAAAMAAGRWYDRPVRAWLSRWFAIRPSTPPQAAAERPPEGAAPATVA